MKQVFWMTAGCVAGWLTAAALTDRSVEAFFGMAGPLAAAVATWLTVERTWRRDPVQVTRLLIGALFVKMLFFGVYVVAISRVPGIDLAAFAVAFAVFFVALYAAQAFLLRRLTTVQPS